MDGWVNKSLDLTVENAVLFLIPTDSQHSFFFTHVAMDELQSEAAHFSFQTLMHLISIISIVPT